MKELTFHGLVGYSIGLLVNGGRGVSPLAWGWDSWAVASFYSLFVACIWWYDTRNEA